MKIKSLKTNTYPLIVHAPGWTVSQSSTEAYRHNKLNPLWTSIVNAWRKDKINKISHQQFKDLTIITINNSAKKGILEKSLDRLGVPYIVLGKDVNDWKNIYKIQLFHKAINSINTTYVMGLDAYDVLVLRDPKEAVEKFKNMDCDMLFNGEVTFYPSCNSLGQVKKSFITEEWKEFQKNIAKSPWAYLNAGMWIAKTEFYRKFIKECFTRNAESLVKAGRLPIYRKQEDKGHHQKLTESEQVIMHWVFKDFYPRVQIDYENSIFFNIVKLPRFKGYLKIFRPFYKVPLSELLLLLRHSIRVFINRLLDITRQQM